MPAQKLIRDTAGSYHSSDDRFAVTEEGTAWWVRDAAVHDELGMPRVSGPYPTLDEVKATIEEAEAKAPTKKAAKKSAKKS